METPKAVEKKLKTMTGLLIILGANSLRRRRNSGKKKSALEYAFHYVLE